MHRYCRVKHGYLFFKNFDLPPEWVKNSSSRYATFKNSLFANRFAVSNELEGLFHGTFDPFCAKQGENLAGRI